MDFTLSPKIASLDGSFMLIFLHVLRLKTVNGQTGFWDSCSSQEGILIEKGVFVFTGKGASQGRKGGGQVGCKILIENPRRGSLRRGGGGPRGRLRGFWGWGGGQIFFFSARCLCREKKALFDENAFKATFEAPKYL